MWIEPQEVNPYAERLTHMLGKKEKKNTKEEVPFHIKWAWLGDGKDWRNSALVITFVFILMGVLWYLTGKPPWCTRDVKHLSSCEQYYPKTYRSRGD